MSQGVPATPDITALIQMQESAKKSATFNLVILVVLIIAFLAGGYTVYKNLTAPPPVQSSPGPVKKATEITTPTTRDCDPGTELVTYNGKYECGPICGPNQIHVMTGPTGSTYLVCRCPGTGFISSTQCSGCIPESCPTGFHICPTKGICACTEKVEGACTTYIDPITGEILQGSMSTDPDCPVTCVDTDSYLSTIDGIKLKSQLDAVCKDSPCNYESRNRLSLPECSPTGSKFDGFSIELGTCYKRMNCDLRPDTKAIAMYGPDTISNFPASCLNLKSTPEGYCTPLTTTDIRNKCLIDTDGCPIGYRLSEGVCLKSDLNMTGPTILARAPAGCRTPGTFRTWDGVSCLGSVGYDLLLNIYQCQTTWSVVSSRNVNAFTQIGATIAVPRSRIRGVQRFVFQIAGYECSMTTVDKTIIINGNKGGITVNPQSAPSDVDFPEFADQALNRSDYQFYTIEGIFGTDRSTSLFPTQDRTTWNRGSTPQIPYRFTVGLLIQGTDGKYVLNSLTKESQKPSDQTDRIGLLHNISMSEYVTRVPGGLPTPPSLDGDIARQVFSENTANVGGLNSLLRMSVASATNDANELSVNSPLQSPVNYVSNGIAQPYCIAGCLPDYCPGILDVTSPDNIQVKNQIVVFAINIDLSNITFPLNTDGTTRTVPQKEAMTSMYIVRTPLGYTGTRPWATQMNQPGYFIVDDKNEKFVLSNIKSTTTTSNQKYYVMTDYVEAGKNYRYDIGYYWGDTNYKVSLDQGKASSLRTFMVYAPPYTRDACWSIPYTGNPNLPPHMILGPGVSCVYPGFVNPSFEYGTNAPFDFRANIYSTGPVAFSNIKPKNIKLWAGSNYYSMTGVGPVIRVGGALLDRADTVLELDPPIDWSRVSPNWFGGINNRIEVELEDGIISDRDYNVGYSAEQYKTRLTDMDAFGRRNIPGYVPLAGDVKQYARGPTGILINPGFYDFDSQPNAFTNNGAGRYVFAQGYNPISEVDRDINQKAMNVLKATNASRFPNSTFYNYVSPVTEEIKEYGRKKIYSADFKYYRKPSSRAVDITPDNTTSITSVALLGATGCLGNPLLMCNRGTEHMYGRCSCEGTATNPGRCHTGTIPIKGINLTY